MIGASQEVIHAYRHLLRASLHAVQFAKPARYVLLNRLRYTFRSSPVSSLVQTRLDRTLELLRGAAAERGYEHKLLKNLVQYWGQETYWKASSGTRRAVWATRPKLKQDVDAIVQEMGRTLDVYVGQSEQRIVVVEERADMAQIDMEQHAEKVDGKSG
ncbi:Hypothetical protein D9617_1g088820 [Elsinoe fawcettii]|nr:Hypothetical protein D9617_1g088820 [Elsinoe fawcettii]